MKLDFTKAIKPQYDAALQTSPHHLVLRKCQLASQSAPELVEAIKAIPATVSSLSWQKDSFTSGAALVEMFKALPATVTELELFKIDLDDMSPEDLLLVFAAIPTTVKTLRLMCNGIWRKSIWADLFQALHTEIRSLDLTGSGLIGLLSVAGLATIFNAFPTKLRSLNLTWNALSGKTPEEVATFLKAISARINTLSLNMNNLQSFSGTGMATIFQAIPSTVTALDLRLNELGRKTGAELALAFKGIPANVTSLDLSENDFQRMSAEETAMALQAIPDTVTSLSLMDITGHNDTEIAKIAQAISTKIKSLRLRAHIVNAVELSKLISVLPAELTSLDLSGNYLGHVSDLELANFFKAIPASVTSLNLGNTLLDRKTTEELTLAFKELGPNVTTLGLGGTAETGQALANILKALPSTVTSVYFDAGQFGNFGRVSIAQNFTDAFQGLPPHVTSLDLSNNYLDNIDLEELLAMLKAIPDTVRRVYLGPTDRPTLRNLEEQQRLREALLNKNFLLAGNSSDIQPSTIEALDSVTLEPLRNIILSYMAEEGDVLPKKSQPMLQPSFLIRFITHPATKIVSTILLMAGLLGLGFAAAGVLSIGLALASAVSTILGGSLLIAGFFATRKTEPVDAVAYVPGAQIPGI